MVDLSDNWLLLAAAVVRCTNDPAELERWRQWARDRQPRTVHQAQKARRIGHMDRTLFGDEDRRYTRHKKKTHDHPENT